MTSSISITKQIYINKFNLSYDVLNKIKSYCFYDIKTWEMLQFIKYKKSRIHHLFTTSTISRANPFDIYFNDANTDEQWVFWTFDENDGGNRQFQCCSCRHCGNYKIIGNNHNHNYINKVICFCVDDYDDIPPLININDDDDDDDDDFIDDDSIIV
jgi:hypothetical protein